MLLHLHLKIVCVRTPRFLVMALEGFSALKFVPSAPGLLAGIKTIFYKKFCPLILRREVSQCHLK